MHCAYRAFFFAAFVAGIAAIYAEAIQLDQDLGREVPNGAVVTLYAEPSFEGESVSLGCVLNPREFRFAVNFAVASLKVKGGSTAWISVSPVAGQNVAVVHKDVADVDATWKGGVIGISALCASVVNGTESCPEAASWPNAPCADSLLTASGARRQRAQSVEAALDELVGEHVAGSDSPEKALEDLLAEAISLLRDKGERPLNSTSNLGATQGEHAGNAATRATVPENQGFVRGKHADAFSDTANRQALSDFIASAQAPVTTTAHLSTQTQNITHPIIPQGCLDACPARLALCDSLHSANARAARATPARNASGADSTWTCTVSVANRSSARPGSGAATPLARTASVAPTALAHPASGVTTSLARPASSGATPLAHTRVAPNRLPQTASLAPARTARRLLRDSQVSHRLLRHSKVLRSSPPPKPLPAPTHRVGVVVVFCTDRAYRDILGKLSCSRVDVFIYSKCGVRPSIPSRLHPCTTVDAHEHSIAGMNALSILEHLYLHYNRLHEVTLFLKDEMPRDMLDRVGDVVAAIGHQHVGYYAFTEAIRDILVEDMKAYYVLRAKDTEFVPTVLRSLQCGDPPAHGVAGSSMSAASNTSAHEGPSGITDGSAGPSPASNVPADIISDMSADITWGGPNMSAEIIAAAVAAARGRAGHPIDSEFSWRGHPRVQDCHKLPESRAGLRPRDLLHCADPLATAWATDYWRTAVHSVFAVARNRVWMWPQCKYAGLVAYIKDWFKRSKASEDLKTKGTWWVFEHIWGEMFHCRPGRDHNSNFVCVGDELVASREFLDDLGIIKMDP